MLGQCSAACDAWAGGLKGSSVRTMAGAMVNSWIVPLDAIGRWSKKWDIDLCYSVLMYNLPFRVKCINVLFRDIH